METIGIDPQRQLQGKGVPQLGAREEVVGLSSLPRRAVMGGKPASTVATQRLSTTTSQAQMWGIPKALAEPLESHSTELINRPGIGFSELAGCMLSWLDVLEDLRQTT